MGSLSLQTIVNTWQHFHLFSKACTKGYIVNSCLAPPLNPDERIISNKLWPSSELCFPKFAAQNPDL